MATVERVTGVCLGCGQTFDRLPCQVRKGKNKYCRRDCSFEQCRRLKAESMKIISGACGCGTQIPEKNRWGQTRKYVNGHQHFQPMADILERLVIGEPTTLPTGCWEYPGRQSQGYGTVSYRGKVWLSHRLIYEHFIRPIPEGLELDHLCRNPACANPEHLEPVPHEVNLQRGKGATKTECPKGHPYSEENTGRAPGGSRYCRQCCRERSNAAYHAKRIAKGHEERL